MFYKFALKFSLFLFFPFFIFSNNTTLQLSRVAVVDMEIILKVVRNDAFLRKILENKSNANLTRINKYNRKINHLRKKIETEDFSEVEQQNIEEEIQSLIREKNEFTINMETGNQYSGSLNNNVIRSLYIIMKTECIRNGYTMLLEKSSGVIYVDEEFDLTKKIIETLRQKKQQAINNNKDE